MGAQTRKIVMVKNHEYEAANGSAFTIFSLPQSFFLSQLAEILEGVSFLTRKMLSGNMNGAEKPV
jgi:hypothetical protein